MPQAPVLPPGRSCIFSACCVIIFCSAGPSAFSVFVDPLMQATGASRGSVSLALTLYQFSMGVFGIIGGRIVDRSGPRGLMYIGGALVGLGWMLMAFSSSLALVLLSFGVTVGAGVGLTYNAAINTALRWYPEKRGAMSGLLLGSASLGTLVMAKVGAVLCHHFGLNGLLYTGLFYLAAMWLVGWLLRAPSPQWKPEGWTPPAPSGGGVLNYTPGAMLRTPTFWILLALFSAACTSGVMMVSALSPIAQTQLGMSPVRAADMVSVSCLANFAGRVLLGRLCDAWGDIKTLGLIFLLTIGSLCGFGMAHSVPGFLVCVIVLGCAFGGVMVVFPPMTTRLFGVVHSGTNYGILFFGYAVGSLIGPQIAAQTMDLSLGAQAYSTPYRLAVGVALFGFVLNMVFLRSQRARH